MVGYQTAVGTLARRPDALPSEHVASARRRASSSSTRASMRAVDRFTLQGASRSTHSHPTVEALPDPAYRCDNYRGTSCAHTTCARTSSCRAGSPTGRRRAGSCRASALTRADERRRALGLHAVHEPGRNAVRPRSRHGARRRALRRHPVDRRDQNALLNVVLRVHGDRLALDWRSGKRWLQRRHATWRVSPAAGPQASPGAGSASFCPRRSSSGSSGGGASAGNAFAPGGVILPSASKEDRCHGGSASFSPSWRHSPPFPLHSPPTRRPSRRRAGKGC